MNEEIRPLQLKQLEILKELKRVCDKHNITYFLAFGTLIGAIRHKGFIPWDDDIDVTMPYKDYKKFERVCKNSLGENFFLQTVDSDPDCGLTYFKLRMNNTTLILDKTVGKDINQGINIDIYPIYHVPDNELLRKFQLVSVALYMLLCVQEVPENWGKTMQIGAKFILSIIRGKNRVKIRNACYKYMSRYENTKTKRVAQFYGNLDRCKRVYPTSWFEGTEDKLFEDEYFKVQKRYDKFLRKRYGDYMKLPPASEQGIKLDHIVKIDVDTPYIKYKGKLY